MVNNSNYESIQVSQVDNNWTGIPVIYDVT